MLVFWEQRLVFLATPKTGSTSIAAVLDPRAVLSIQRPPEFKHTTVQRYHRFVGPYLNAASGHDFEVVALVREPRDWLGSWFRFRQRTGITDPSRSTRGLSFDEFVAAWCEDSPPAFADVGRQSMFLKPRQGRGVDRLFRYEAMDDFASFLGDRLGCAVTLPRLNVSPQADLSLTPATLRRLREAAAEDFALYATLTTV